MPIKYLLQSQANQVLEALKGANWNATDFRWETVKSQNYSGEDASRLVHLASKFYFTFDNSNDTFFSEWSPGNETHHEDSIR